MASQSPAPSPVWDPATDFVTLSKKNAGARRFFYRQLFLTPPPPGNVSLEGKTAIVTGSNNGVGLETSRQLLDLGLSKLILAVRDESKGRAAGANLSSGRHLKDGTIEVWKLDMLSYDSITAFAERTKTLESLDIAVLNAGIMKQTYKAAPSTGHEESIQVNYLSTALLAVLLLPILKSKAEANNRTDPGHLVWLQSELAGWAKFKTKDSVPLLPALAKPENFNIPDNYCVSKLLGQLFVTEFAKRVPSTVAIITMPTPGWCNSTELGTIPGFHIGQVIVGSIKRVLGRRLAIGVRAVVDGAIHGPDAHGQYLEECKIQVKAPFLYTDKAGPVSQRLWEETMAELAFAQVEDTVKELSSK